MTKIPENFYAYKETRVFDENSLPDVLRNMHNTKVGVYGKIQVISGALKYTAFDDSKEKITGIKIIKAWNFAISEPQAWHQVEPIGKMQMLVTFYKKMDDEIYENFKNFSKIFPDKKPHYEVMKLAKIIKEKWWKTALDLGSGLGRNSLYLAFSGLEVTSFDKNIDGLQETQNLANLHNLALSTKEVNLNSEKIEKNYDTIIATVSLQFLEKNSAKNLILDAQNHTNSGGLHLIIVPTLADDIVCEIDFPNMITYDEYLDLYKDWNILETNNFFGYFHKKRSDGTQFSARFAMIIAEKK